MGCVATGVMSLGAAVHGQDAPISSIDWLSDSLATPVVAVAPSNEPPVANSAGIESVTVTPLGAPSPDGIGLIGRRESGFPGNLWGGSELDKLRRLIATLPIEPLPAQQDLIRLLLLTELDPPIGAGPEGFLFQARIDALLARGAVDEAAEMLKRTGSKAPAIFQRAFDVALLQGREDAGCHQLRATPGISPSYSTRIFCLARTGDWQAAALTLDTAKALGHLSEEEDALLARFLEPELADGAEPLPAPERPSPLVYRMLEAIGEPVPTAQLPLAFAHADLRETAGWRARIGAAERLARVGSLAPDRLLEIWSEQKPAASGGVWERVEVMQALDAAVTEADPSRVASLLPEAWAEAQSAHLELPFAALFGPRLEDIVLSGQSAALAFRVGLLTDAYERLALTQPPPPGEMDAFLVALARGLPEEAKAPGVLAEAITEGFTTGTLPETLSRPLADGRIGEAILLSMSVLENGAGGDLDDVTNAIAFLRSVRLEDVARRYALQLMLLDRRG
ncbi:hypothetical protein [Vannielia litorea]|uniref:Uncharacterized protein n=1 Tax=Vannielia litorea TaxID=1217970 RepID=A0A1N6F5N0_9RHOB|nr:hypothetical protein [Vannielia litorea]SIN90571.1 hypothetical protein SAMN05444002_1395 [Vannielia litorea]